MYSYINLGVSEDRTRENKWRKTFITNHESKTYNKVEFIKNMKRSQEISETSHVRQNNK